MSHQLYLKSIKPTDFYQANYMSDLTNNSNLDNNALNKGPTDTKSHLVVIRLERIRGDKGWYFSPLSHSFSLVMNFHMRVICSRLVIGQAIHLLLMNKVMCQSLHQLHKNSIIWFSSYYYGTCLNLIFIYPNDMGLLNFHN